MQVQYQATESQADLVDGLKSTFEFLVESIEKFF